MTAYEIIKRPIITEQSMERVAEKRYVFEVDRRAGKIEIKKAFEEAFGVKVAKVNTINYDGKVRRQGYTSGRRPAWKKAIITLTPDSKGIELFEGMY